MLPKMTAPPRIPAHEKSHPVRRRESLDEKLGDRGGIAASFGAQDRMILVSEDAALDFERLEKLSGGQEFAGRKSGGGRDLDRGSSVRPIPTFGRA